MTTFIDLNSMYPSFVPVVKICCIAGIGEAMTAFRAGAKVIGLVGSMPSGPGPISDDLIAEIAQSVPSQLETFLLTSETSSKKIIEHYKRVRTTAVQMVDHLEQGSYEEIRNVLPGVKLVQVVHVRGEKSIEEAIHLEKSVDALLLDSGNPDLPLKELGGTGRTHDWNISKRIRESVTVPVFLAGGLNPANVKQAIDIVRPFGVDLCSGVRTEGKLDTNKLKGFFRAVRDEN